MFPQPACLVPQCHVLGDMGNAQASFTGIAPASSLILSQKVFMGVIVPSPASSWFLQSSLLLGPWTLISALQHVVSTQTFYPES